MGYPQRLRLVCQFCFQVWGAEHAQATVVGRFPHGELVPLCDAHHELAQRYGMTPRRLLLASRVQQELLDTYAVELLPPFSHPVPAPPMPAGHRWPRSEGR